MMSDVAIKVAIRVRPLIGQELLQSSNQCIKCLKGKPQLVIGKNRGFSFDYVFDPSDFQVSIYKQCVSPLLNGFFQGYNSAIIAYGQTGAGKTFTMGTSDGDLMVDDTVGILPRAIQEIFERLSQNNCEWHMKVSFIEIYLEDVTDLLHNDGGRKELFIREDDKGNTVVAGLTKQIVTSYDEVMTLLDIGAAVRQTADTKMNEDSSRSHCIFTIHLDQFSITNKCELDVSSTVTSAKFNFVDLAGSERLHHSFNRGERFRESVSINSGLLSLGNVISILSDPKRRNLHVPYRDSKLTRLLKDSLGGNSKTLLVCCVSPSTSSMDESLTTLKFAQRVQKVKNQPIVNIATNESKLNHMKEELKCIIPLIISMTGALAGDRIASWFNTLKNKLETYNHERTDTDHSNSAICKELVNRITEIQHLLSSILLQDNIDARTFIKLKEWKSSIRQMSTVVDVLQIFNDAMEQHEKTHSRSLQTDINVNELEQEKSDLTERLHTLEKENTRKEWLLNENKLNLVDIEYESDHELTLVEDVTEENNHTGSINTKVKHNIPKSAPDQRNTLYAEMDRKILQSSPGALGCDRIISRFRAESQLLALELMKQDSVAYDDDNFSSDDNDVIKEQDTIKEASVIPTSITNVQQHKVSSARERRRLINKTASKLPIRNKKIPLQHNLRKSKEVYQVDLEQSLQKSENHKFQLEKLTTDIRCHEEVSSKHNIEIENLRSAKQISLDKVKILEAEVKSSKFELEEARKKLKRYKEQQEKNNDEKNELEIEYNTKSKQMNSKILALETETLAMEQISLMYEDSKSRIRELENDLIYAKEQENELKQQLVIEEKHRMEMEERLTELELEKNKKGGINDDRSYKESRVAGKNGKILDEQFNSEIEWIEFEIDRIASKQIEAKHREKEIDIQNEALRKREALIQTRESMESEKLRCSQILEKDLLKVSIQLDNVNEQLQQMAVNNNTVGATSRLESKRNDLYSKATAIDQQLKDDNALERVDQSAMFEINEAIDAVNMSIAYNKEILNQDRQTFSEAQIEKDINSLFNAVGKMNNQELHHVTRGLMERMIDLKTEVDESYVTIDTLNVDIADRDKAGLEMERYCKRIKLLADRQMDECKRNQQQEIQSLNSQINELRNNRHSESNKLEKKIKQLEKDLYYYKRTSRDLKHKLREFMPADSTNRASSSASMETREDQSLPSDNNEFHLPRVNDSPSKLGNINTKGNKNALASRQNLLDRIAAEEHRKLKKIFEDQHYTPSENHSKESRNSKPAKSPSPSVDIQDSIDGGNKRKGN